MSFDMWGFFTLVLIPFCTGISSRGQGWSGASEPPPSGPEALTEVVLVLEASVQAVL